MDFPKDANDKSGEVLISYLDSPKFSEASSNATRLVGKLRAAIHKQELYESHQILRTIYFRFTNSKEKIESLVDLLYHGAEYLLDNSESISGQDIASLFLESSAKYLHHQTNSPPANDPNYLSRNLAQSHSSDRSTNRTKDVDICHKISNLAIKLPDSEIGQAKFIAEALKLLPHKILDRDLLHSVIARTFWQHKNFTNARYHFLHCASLDNAQEIATLLVEYHQKSANKSEKDLFLAQFIFQFLCLQSPLDTPKIGSTNTSTGQPTNVNPASRKSRNTIKMISEKIFSLYTLKHPQLGQVEVPFSNYPLLNFTYFIISILDAKKLEHETFKLLCNIYKPAWSRDPNYHSYLNRIGVLFFGLVDENKQQQQQGGFFNNILMSLIEGAEEDDEDDSSRGGNILSSSDELD